MPRTSAAGTGLPCWAACAGPAGSPEGGERARASAIDGPNSSPAAHPPLAKMPCQPHLSSTAQKRTPGL